MYLDQKGLQHCFAQNSRLGPAKVNSVSKSVVPISTNISEPGNEPMFNS